MNLHIARQMRLCMLTAAVIGGLTTTSQAGIIPWLYDAVFGPPGSMMYGANYGGTYGAGYRGYYGGSAYGYGAGYGYGNAPAATAGCNTCGVNNATYYGPVGYGSTGTCCATNDCSIPSAGQTTTNRTPTPADNGPAPEKTLDDEPNIEGDDGFRPNTRGNTDPTSTEAFRIPQNGEKLPQRPTPEADDAVEDEKSDEPQAEQLRVPALNLDTAMTTRPVVAHNRTEWHARFTTPTIARKIHNVNTDWIPVSSERRIAGK